jgi:Holliday junction resolvase RusA-like endonuclease
MTQTAVSGATPGGRGAPRPSWTVTVPGVPPSTNHAYRIVVQKRGQVPYRTLAKTPEAVNYQSVATMLVRAAKPYGWKAGEQVRVGLRFYFPRRQDADNSMKILLDAVARALRVDDVCFLPCVLSKEIVPQKEARVEVTIT